MNTRTCVFCGSGIDPDDRFCGSCGQVTQIDQVNDAASSFDELRVVSDDSEFIDDDPTPPRPRAVPAPWYEPTAPDPDAAQAVVASSASSPSTQSAEHAPLCGSCFTELDSIDVASCPDCDTPFHSGCWAECGGCTVYGCKNWVDRQMAPASAAGAFVATSGPAASGGSTAPMASVAAPSGWYPDPRHRHQFRYFDGNQWTVIVSDAGVVANDELGIDPTPVAPPPGGPHSAPSWYIDPAGRYQYRYWDGLRWTNRTATNQQEFTDPL